MWVYTRKDDAIARQQLSDSEGFWLDYWLFLHGDETDRLWSCRPLGVAALGALAASIRYPVDRRLGFAITNEIRSYERLAQYLMEPVPQELLQIDPRLSPPKSGWLARIQEPEFGASLRQRMAEATVKAITVNDLFSVAFLCRRMASEFADVYASDRAVHQSAVTSLLRNEKPESFKDRLYVYLTDRPRLRSFVVQVRLSPVTVAHPVANWKYGEDVELITEEAAEYSLRPLSLIGAKVIVKASGAEWAATAALRRARDTLETLRVRHYVRTNVYGALAVASEDGQTVYVPLSQPFWDKKEGRKAVPFLARPPRSSERIYATSWHISEAINAWAENIHLAASEIWQAIEAASAGTSPEDLADRYLAAHPAAVMLYWAQCASQQAGRYRAFLGDCDWYYFNAKRVDISKWIGRVIHPESTNHYSKWKNPRCPAIYFDQRVGLLTAVRAHVSGKRRLDFLQRRLRSELNYLYGVRNRAVHQGDRTAPDRWVGFLARLGLELLLMSLSVERRDERLEGRAGAG